MSEHVRLVVSGEVLREALKMPDDVKIVGATSAIHSDTIELVLCGPDFPGAPQGGALAVIEPVITRNEDGEIAWNWVSEYVRPPTTCGDEGTAPGR